MMFRTRFCTATIFLALSAVSADAKLPSAALPAPDDAAHAAFHTPTGCQARIVLRGNIFLKAQITDPNCLPKGVKARDIPGTRYDFLITPK